MMSNPWDQICWRVQVGVLPAAGIPSLVDALLPVTAGVRTIHLIMDAERTENTFKSVKNSYLEAKAGIWP